MKIKSKNYILENVYDYDIISCHFNILKSFGYDISYFMGLDKKDININIGQMMKDNYEYVNYLRKNTRSLIDNFNIFYNIDDTEIIIREYDGILLDKYFILDHSLFRNFKIKKRYSKMIVSIDKKSYIAIDENGEIIYKGISNCYPLILKYYYKLLSLVGKNFDIFFDKIEKIYNKFLNDDNLYLFMIPNKNIKSQYYIYLKGYGLFDINDSIINYINIDDIDKEYYFKNYLSQFVKALIYEMFNYHKEMNIRKYNKKILNRKNNKKKEYIK